MKLAMSNASTRPTDSGTSVAFVGHDACCHGRAGVSPDRSRWIKAMNDSGLWNPWALVRIRPMEALFDSAMPLVSCHSTVARIESPGHV